MWQHEGVPVGGEGGGAALQGPDWFSQPRPHLRQPLPAPYSIVGHPALTKGCIE